MLLLASANAVNLTDGLDGLASGAAILNFALDGKVVALVTPVQGTLGRCIRTHLHIIDAQQEGVLLVELVR